MITALVISLSSAHAASFAKGESFHKGGTGECNGCHATGASEIALRKNRSAIDLLGSDASSTCLRCHEASDGSVTPQGHYIATSGLQLGEGMAPVELTPAGDFGWLKKNYRWRGENGRMEESQGQRHGHNIVAADYGYTADSKITMAPGGNYPSQKLSCTSCHDPHGNYRRAADGTISNAGLPIIASGSYTTSPEPGPNGTVSTYRMLAGKGYQDKGGAGLEFRADPPAAIAPVSYNRDESVNDTRVAYGSGMSEWCSNCHDRMHADNSGRASQHPSGKNARLGAESASNYNSYVASGNLNGSMTTAYNSLVPFEMGTDDYQTLKATANSNGSNRSGANMDSNVMCLSCHRAHASGFDSMTRWNVSATFIVYNGAYPGTDNGAPESIAQGRTSGEVKKAMYGKKALSFASYQRSLCNKCHAKD
ncbi:cytochrome C [Geomonas sp. Red69]|uniref:Cytochrome C n=2 Tax=Geomonas diazotrophica TaxID=2843197 RepID=A0ABX8JH80_9BACT|nr:cytochrome C [Geomonas diazotrophica]QWV96496.1 cytochrome C [Geomonas nitrogeniifigens]